MKHNGIEIHDLSLEELSELFERLDTAGDHLRASKVLTEMLSRVDYPAPSVNDVPEGFTRLIPSQMWAQKAEGEGRSKV